MELDQNQLTGKLTEIYSKETIETVKNFYLLAILVWIIILIICRFDQFGIVGLIILLIPIPVFLINYFNINTCSKTHEGTVLKGNILTFTLLIVTVLINYKVIQNNHRPEFLRVLTLAILLLMLSLIDLWLPPSKYFISLNIKTMLQTAALSLLAFVLYLYYTDVLSRLNQYSE